MRKCTTNICRFYTPFYKRDLSTWLLLFVLLYCVKYHDQRQLWEEEADISYTPR